MTQLLEQAFKHASELEPKDQDALARWLLRELESERNWRATFDNTQDQLARLADKALAELRDGDTEDLSLNSLRVALTCSA